MDVCQINQRSDKATKHFSLEKSILQASDVKPTEI